ncbi:hypothetical protein DGWBC_0255 [Dehalogenimonas sp. WBC-2]|nr:hypothetical protein DGWBC_0255 [Dehalogenimonas sp. WBC-2]
MPPYNKHRRLAKSSGDLFFKKVKNAKTTSFLRLKLAKTTGCFPEKQIIQILTLFNNLNIIEHMLA